MFVREEKWEERIFWREKWREDKKMSSLVEEKIGKKRKEEGKKVVGPTSNFFSPNWRENKEENLRKNFRPKYFYKFIKKILVFFNL